MIEQETSAVNRLERIVESAPQVIQVVYALPPSRDAPYTQHCARDVPKSFLGRGPDGVFIDDRIAPNAALYLPRAEGDVFGYTTSMSDAGGRRRLLILSDTQIPLDPEQDSLPPEFRRFYERFIDADQGLSPLPVIEGRQPEYWEVMEEAMREKSRQLKQSRRQLQATTRRFRRLAYMDDNTELPNRRAYWGDMARNVEEAIAYGKKMHVLALDAIGFKKINDEYGQVEGDGVIRQLGEILKRVTRAEDKVYRIGGDEFRVVTDADPYMLKARFEKVVPVATMSVTGPGGTGEEVYLQGVYVGIASFDGARSGVLTEEERRAIFVGLEKKADAAMQEVKAARKAR